MTINEIKRSLLVTKLQDELSEYMELEHYRSRKSVPKTDRRYWLSVKIIKMAENGKMKLDNTVLSALLSIDGILFYCWDLWSERRIAVRNLFCELCKCYNEGEVW